MGWSWVTLIFLVLGWRPDVSFFSCLDSPSIWTHSDALGSFLSRFFLYRNITQHTSLFLVSIRLKTKSLIFPPPNSHQLLLPTSTKKVRDHRPQPSILPFQSQSLVPEIRQSPLTLTAMR